MNSLDKQYQDLLQSILDYGVEKKDRTGTGTKSIFGYTIRHNMADGFPLLTTKRMYWKGIVTELLWFLRGDTNIKFLVDNDCHIWNGDAYKQYENSYAAWVGNSSWSNNGEPWDKENFIRLIKEDERFCSMFGDLGPIYGKQWRAWGGEQNIPTGWHHGAPAYPKKVKKDDQLSRLISDLKTNPDSRRLMVSAWNVSEIDQMVLPPCHYGFQVYTRELSKSERYQHLRTGKYSGKWDGNGNEMEYYDSIGVPKRAISLMWSQRSVDTPLGLPFNIASYGLLLCIIAEIVNMVPDQLIGNLGDTHIYLNQLEGVKEQLKRDSFSLPSLRINTEYWLTESGECGIGPFTDNLDALVKGMQLDDFQIEGYEYHPAIKFPLSN